MNHIYLDEAGNTGHDLLNIDQPVFVLAANMFTEEEALELLKILDIKGAEAKFSNLKKTKKGRNKIKKFMEQVILKQKKVKTVIVHKKYMGLGKIFDILVEPVYFKMGVNFNKNMRNVCTVNMHWYVITSFYGERNLNKLIRRFIALIHSKSESNIDEFYKTVDFIKRNPIKINNTLDFNEILASKNLVQESIKVVDKTHLDPVQTGLFTQATLWGKDLPDGFVFIHDESNTLESSLNNFNRYTDPTSIPKVIGTGERAYELPLKVEKVSLEKSHIFPQIQVSDIIAGALAHTANCRAFTENKDDQLSLDLISIGIEQLMTHSVWPETKVTPKDFGILDLEEEPINPVDQIASFLLSNKKTDSI
ncbi:DUF3800 domain-containing protein [Acinetobacter tibetensis]|uniref:DUF3800 domain-containing protein n=1 Tax=Acinetobacter tibetensis TaxID=2943497 RepID=UPI003A4D511C